jgi:hypothetical protein
MPHDSAPSSHATGPLWVERVRLRQHLEEMGLPPIPSFKALLREAAFLQDAVATGHAVYPPPQLVNLPNRRMFYPPTCDPHALAAFMCLPSVERLTNAVWDRYARHGLRGDEAAPHVHLMMHELHAVTLWGHYGRRVYVLEAGFFEALSHTELPDVPTTALRFPLAAFYLAFPAGAFRFRVAMDPNAQPAEGVLVTTTGVAADDGGEREMGLLVTGRSPLGVSDDNIAFEVLRLRPHESVRQLEFPGLASLERMAGTPIVASVSRTILGLLLYLQSEHPALRAVEAVPRRDLTAIKSAAKRRAAEVQDARESHLPLLIVGPPPLEPREVDERPAGDAPHQGRSEHWVSGHWRFQAVGVQWRDRRLTWIAPHQRGTLPESATGARYARVVPGVPTTATAGATAGGGSPVEPAP